MTTEPQEHGFIAQVCAEDAARRVPPRLSDDPAVRLADCLGYVCNVDEGCGQDIPEYFVAACDKFDWKPEEALRFYAEGKHFDTVDGRTRILCTGAIASHALKGIRGQYADMKGIEAFDEDAERVKFERHLDSKNIPHWRYTEYAGVYAGRYSLDHIEEQWQGWLACAKSRAEGK